MNGTMKSNTTTPLHLVAMFSLDVGLFWFDPPPLVFFVVPPDAGPEEGAAGPELEAALGALQFSQHLLLGSMGCQPNVQKGKQG